MDILSNFSETLKELMHENKLTHTILKDATGCPISNVSKWLNKKTMPLLPSLMNLSAYFNCSLDYLLGRTDIIGKPLKIVSSFPERIVKLCKNYNNITLYRLSKELGMNDDLIYSWVHNAYIPNLYNLCKIADYFDCSVDYLVGYED